MYDFVTHTSNPIKGLCSIGCSYCYMRTFYTRYGHDKTLRLDEKELNCNYGRGKFIFVGSSTDMFASDVKNEWILKVYDHCVQYGQNRYLFQSKNPSRFLDPNLFSHPLMCRKDLLCFATTLETNREYPVVSKAASKQERVLAMRKIREMGYSVMITMEPIMDFDIEEVVSMLEFVRPFQVNIGCDTSKSLLLPEPNRHKLLDLVHAVRRFTGVKLKSNSSRILGNLTRI